ncbi:Transcription factor spt20 [Chytridiales sp. JEL 0842]|nr:Transcription factor spt20 [Chytridiales sp. JEL 0842]
MIVEVFPNHIKFPSLEITSQLNGSLKGVLESISQQKLTPENAAFFSDADFNNGSATLDIHDYRGTLRHDFGVAPGSAGAIGGGPALSLASASPSQNLKGYQAIPTIMSFSLQPDNRLLYDDIYKIASANNVALTDSMMAEIESKILEATETDLCLDPSPSVLQSNSIITYNQTKYRQCRKRPRESLEKEEEAAEKKATMKMMLLSDEKREFQPTFSRAMFIEDYRRRKMLEDEEVMLGVVEQKKTKQRKLAGTSSLNSSKVIKTIRFEQPYEISGETIYTIFNVVESGMPDEYEGIIRRGNAEGTAKGKHGLMLRFPIGNLAAVEKYMHYFKNFYSVDNKLKNQSAVQLPGSTPSEGVTTPTSTWE